MDRDYLLIIDGSSLLSTQFFGNLPPAVMYAKTLEEKEKLFDKIMHTSKGVYTNGIFGFMRTLLKIVKDQKPAYLAIAWDLSRNTFRRDKYPEYKANRGETLVPLAEQFDLCMSVLERMGIRQFANDRYEADDYCGTLAKTFEDTLPVRIITKDRDYLQLVTEKTNLWMMHSSAQKTEELYKKYNMLQTTEVPDRCFPLTPELVLKEYGVEPESIADLKGIEGDASDNIKGVPGVGEATAIALISKYKSVEALYEAIDGLDAKAQKEMAASWKKIGILRSPMGALLKTGEGLVGREAAFLSKWLATIKCDVPLDGLSLSDLALKINVKETEAVFEELEFKSLKAELTKTFEQEQEVEYSVTCDMTEAEEQVISLAGRGFIGVALAKNESGFLGAAFSDDSGKACFVEASGFIEESYIERLISLLDQKGTVIVADDIKQLIKQLDIEELSNAFDIELAKYLIDPLKGEYSYTAKGMDPVGNACELAFLCAREKQELVEKLNELGLTRLYENIELPLVYVLNDMEKRGISVNEDDLTEFSKKLESDISVLENRIYECAGERFNVNSPKQLGTILFEKLHLPYYGKKMKTGYSTSAEVLEELRLEDPIIGAVLEYRQLAKLKSTYADGLRDFICADGRIRTTFNQKVTATGRLSSTEPNLQNIPVRTELGRYLRKVFTASEGYVFVDADYSQIELRILAALSGDEKLIAAFRDSLDIHRSTASEVFKIPFDEVTKEQRARAKAVNFGIVYGISSFGLSNDIGCTKKEAEDYIRSYYETYPGIKAYLEGLVQSAKNDGVSVTYFGRRRPMPELSEHSHGQRQFGERIAKNMPIQGTAADIIKIAMVNVYKRLRRDVPSAHLLLQVHDELLVEARQEDVAKVSDILSEEMRNAAVLSVSLDVDVESGKDWLEAH